MFWRQVAAYFRGYLVVKLQWLYPEKTLYPEKSVSLERFINNSIRKGIFLWDVKRVSVNTMIFKIVSGDLKLIRNIIRQAGCRGKVIARVGWPFFWRGLLKRRGWILGMLLFFASLYILASFIWFIKVEGTDRISARQITSDLEKLGLYPGVARGKIEEKRDLLIREMKIRYPETVFISVELKGVLARVKVVEKNLPPEKKEKTGDLYASKAGLVTEVVVIEGTSHIKEGDTVGKGDLLIIGKKVLRRLDGTIETIEVKAVGTVKARVWYEVQVEEPLLHWSAKMGGEKKTVYGLRVKKRLYPFFSWGKVSGNIQRTRERFEIYKGRNRLNLVELVKDTYTEVTWVKKRVSPGTALNRAEEEGKEKLLYILPSGVKPLKYQEEWEIREGFLHYRLVAETLENIAVYLQKEEKP